MTQEQIDQYLATGRHIVSFAAGAGAATGLLTQTSSADIAGDFDHIFNGIKEIAIGAGPLITLAMAWWAAHSSTLPAKVAAVKAADPVTLVQAVQQVAPSTLRDAVAAQPDVTKVVVTTKAAADASPSPKVTTNALPDSQVAASKVAS
jgi:hypothetical protein